MKSNKVLSVFGLVATFAACFALGYFIPLDSLVNVKSKAEIAAEKEAAEKVRQDSLAAVAAAEMALAQAEADRINNKPVIEAFHPKKIQSFGYNLSVTATVPSGDALVYELCEVGTSTVKYKSTNGYIGSRQSVIVPSESGSYDLVVTNSRTGDSARVTVNGFNKVNKLNESQLGAYLNSDSYAKDFYAYLVEASKQQISFENLPAGVEGLTNVDALGPTRIAYGWTFEVVAGSLQYDKYNRIQSFRIRIIE